ncbi:helix-turn-helix domain-containing protein [Thalassospira marina]|uniref:HTH cro/C1-type domain-containing protein n=1 Tax=Thalassospira marina TaxID=2048283 RepID=A0A2N3KXZ1_9PROT|nr:helix-turn-helix transcriptional regulator [Thalassospira marina]PKR55432.1 hypothetical protein COO20_04480 [Thalassospira marina]
MSGHTEALQKAIDLAGSQTKLAERVGRSQQTISRYMREETIPYALAVKITAATGIPLPDFLPELKAMDPHA